MKFCHLKGNRGYLLILTFGWQCDFNIDDETISKIGLILSDKPINAQIAPNARVFEYPHLDNVFIMESDLYGNTMPKNSCFLAFYGTHGLIGKH